MRITHFVAMIVLSIGFGFFFALMLAYGAHGIF